MTVWSFYGDGPEGTQPGILELHDKWITSLAFARRGMRLASGARDGIVSVWLLQRDGDGRSIGAAMMVNAVSELAWRPDGRALAAFDSHGATVWRVK